MNLVIPLPTMASVQSVQSLELAGTVIGEMFRRPEGLHAWGKSHHSLYNPAKSGALAATHTKLVDLNNPRNRSSSLSGHPAGRPASDHHHASTEVPRCHH